MKKLAVDLKGLLGKENMNERFMLAKLIRYNCICWLL